jgi:hypothetical protein
MLSEIEDRVSYISTQFGEIGNCEVRPLFLPMENIREEYRAFYP